MIYMVTTLLFSIYCMIKEPSEGKAIIAFA